MKYVLSIFCLLLLAFSAKAQQTADINSHTRNSKHVKTIKRDSPIIVSKEIYDDTTACFPMSKDRLYNIYDYVINLNDIRVVKRYKPYFDKYKYRFSGYVWEAMLRCMLADTDKDLSSSIIIRSDQINVTMRVTKHTNTQRLPAYLCGIFSNLSRFEGYLKNADRNIIPDY